MRVTCPVEDHEGNDVLGCGRTFDTEPDGEGWVDCPGCGLGFDPRHPNSAPQPEDAQ